jgi:hypothetical protein
MYRIFLGVEQVPSWQRASSDLGSGISVESGDYRERFISNSKMEIASRTWNLRRSTISERYVVQRWALKAVIFTCERKKDF